MGGGGAGPLFIKVQSTSRNNFPNELSIVTTNVVLNVIKSGVDERSYNSIFSRLRFTKTCLFVDNPVDFLI